MLPMPPPQEIAIVSEVIRPMEALWSNFDLSYEGLLTIVERLEKAADYLEVSEEPNEEAVKELRRVVIDCARLGSIDATSSEFDILMRDIAELFVDDEEDCACDDLFFSSHRSVGWKMSPMSIYSDPDVIYSKSLWKKVARTVKKIAP